MFPISWIFEIFFPGAELISSAPESQEKNFNG